MGRSIESYGRRSLDADVEKDGAKEINWDDTYSYLYTEEELEQFCTEREEEEQEKIIQKMVAESEEPEEFQKFEEAYDYDAQSLRAITFDVSWLDKTDADKMDEKMHELLAKEVEELEGIF